MRTCWRLFAFGGADRQAAQVWLNAQTAAGWRLKGVYGGLLARFEQDTRNIPRCCVRPWPTRREVQAGYYQHWADHGWERTAGSWGLEIFSAQPGRFPLWPEGDGEEDEASLFRQAWRSCLGAALAAVLSALWCGRLGWSAVLLNDLCLAGAAAALVLNLLLAGYGISLLIRWNRRCRGGEPVPSLRGARMRYFCGGAVWLLACVLLLLNGMQALQGSAKGTPQTAGPLVRAEELGLEGAGSLYGQEGRSVLAAWSRTQEFLRAGEAPAGAVVCDVYRCVGPITARVLANILRAEEAQGRSLHLLERHGALSWSRAELGFDRAWIAREGERICLLAVEGASVALVEAPGGVNSPEVLALIRARMEPPGGG